MHIRAVSAETSPGTVPFPEPFPQRKYLSAAETPTELRQHATADPRVTVLTTLPGVGQFTALVMLAEIGDITRFGSACKLASWAGLTPSQPRPCAART